MNGEALELLTISELSKLLRRCKASIRNDVRAGRLPPPLSLGLRHHVWLRQDIHEYLKDARISARRVCDGGTK